MRLGKHFAKSNLKKSKEDVMFEDSNVQEMEFNMATNKLAQWVASAIENPDIFRVLKTGDLELNDEFEEYTAQLHDSDRGWVDSMQLRFIDYRAFNSSGLL